MKLQLLNETVQDLIRAIAERYSASFLFTGKLADDDIKNVIDVVDRYSVNPKYKQFVLKQWAKSDIRLPEDGPRVSEALTNFHNVKARLQNKDLLSYKRLHDLETAVEPLIGSASKRQGGSDIIDPTKLSGVELVGQNGRYKCIKIYEEPSLQKLGEGTKWCTRGSYGKDCMAEWYLEEYEDIYQIWDGNKPIIQFTPDFDQIMDVNDVDTTLHEYIDILPKYPLEYIDKLSEPQEPTEFEGPYSDTLVMIHRYMMKAFMANNVKYEQILVNYKKMNWATQYARLINERVSPTLEKLIAREGLVAVNYARKFGRIPAFERLLLRWYYTDVIKYYSEVYVPNTNNRQWPELEKQILDEFNNNTIGKIGHNSTSNTTRTAVAYAAKIEYRWKELEQYLLNVFVHHSDNRDILFDYLYYVVKDSWPEFEQYLRNISNTYGGSLDLKKYYSYVNNPPTKDEYINNKMVDAVTSAMRRVESED